MRNRKLLASLLMATLLGATVAYGLSNGGDASHSAPQAPLAAPSVSADAETPAQKSNDAVIAAADASSQSSVAGDAPPSKVWFSANSDFSRCIQPSRGPADRIRDIQADGSDPKIVEDGDKVEVTKFYNLSDTTWTYYKSKEACEQRLHAHNDLASKYE